MVIHHRRCAPHSRRQLNFCKSFVGCNPRRASKHTNFYNCGNTIISFSQRFRDPNALLSLERRRRNSAMVIPFVIWGRHSRMVRESLHVCHSPRNAQKSHSHSHSLKIPWGGGVKQDTSYQKKTSSGGPKQNGGGYSPQETGTSMGRCTVGLCAEHGYTVPVSAVGAATAQQSLILPTVQKPN